jgi:hypothetical protein
MDLIMETQTPYNSANKKITCNINIESYSDINTNLKTDKPEVALKEIMLIIFQNNNCNANELGRILKEQFKFFEKEHIELRKNN